jgi:[ribosomal protein S5]-alanine N-acetyltransferase
VEVGTLKSPRLELVSMSPAFLEPLFDGRRDEAAAILGAELPDDWPDRHDEGFLRLRLGQMRRDPESQQWLVRAIVLPGAQARMIGHAGFHGAPGVNGPRKPGALELGYAVFPPFRGRGYATETVVALIEWAQAEHNIRRFIASVSPTNGPSLAIVKKLGFVQTGEQWDEEDGLELVFELAWPAGAKNPD